MCAIKNAIIDGNYPITKKVYVHPTQEQSQDYFINDEEIAKFNKERAEKARAEWLTKELESDKTDEWRESQGSTSEYMGSGQSFDR